MEKEKKFAALTSVIAACFLLILKLITGLFTGSLGILSEAAHSALDLIASLMTYFAINLSIQPPDKNHNYGHGKIENLSALIQVVILIFTCVWIIIEAISRLFSTKTQIHINIYAFLIMVIAVVIDFSRVSLLTRVAKKYESQALEADALHFKSDIMASVAVIIGLCLVTIGERVSFLSFLIKADAICAIFVSILIARTALKLGLKSSKILIDTAPTGMEDKIRTAVENIPGIINCHNIRMRYSGSTLFVDVHILLDGSQSLDDAHSLTENVELVVQQIVPYADVTVHPEPWNKK